MKPATALIVLLSATLVAWAGCMHRPDEDGARNAFDRLQKALETSDPAALWDLSDDETHRYFDDLSNEIHAGIAAIDAHYPDADRPAARTALLGALLGAGENGQALFNALLDRARLAPPSDPEAGRIEKVEARGDRMVVITGSGDSIEFRRDDGGNWRTGMFLRVFKALPMSKTLHDNLVTVKANCVLLASPEASK